MSSHQYDKQDLRAFIQEYEAKFPQQVKRIKQEVDLDYDATAIAFELDKRRENPLVIFENVKGSKFPVLMNMFAARDRYAEILGVSVDELPVAWGAMDTELRKPEMLENGPVKDVVITGDELDLGYLPIMKNFLEDGGRYLTNAMFIAKDPETGVRN